MATDKIKVRLRCGANSEHLGYVNKPLLWEFQRVCEVVNYTAWVRQKAFQMFHLRIDSAEDIEKLRGIVASAHYDSIGEWLQEQMRRDLQDRLDDDAARKTTQSADT